MNIGFYIGIAIRLSGQAIFGGGGGVGLSPPRNLRYTETMGNPGYVDFTWDEPVSWGDSGPSTVLTRYQHEIRLESSSSGNLNPWSGILHGGTTRTARVHWAAGHRHGPNRLEFRVRARAADGTTSDWLTSPILTEDAVNPRRGPFSRQFSRQFEGGGA